MTVSPSFPTGPEAPEQPLPLETSAGRIHVGFFTRREKIRRVLWCVVNATLFRWSLRRADRWRSFLLRCFGAQVGRDVLIRRTVDIEVPWNLTLGDEVKLGDHVVLYDLGPLEIGDRSRISQYAHVCGGSHDYTRSDMPLHRVPIRIGADVWICTDSYIGPGVTIGDGAMVGARSNVFGDLPPWQICVGNPAKPVRARPFRRVPKQAKGALQREAVS